MLWEGSLYVCIRLTAETAYFCFCDSNNAHKGKVLIRSSRNSGPNFYTCKLSKISSQGFITFSKAHKIQCANIFAEKKIREIALQNPLNKNKIFLFPFTTWKLNQMALNLKKFFSWFGNPDNFLLYENLWLPIRRYQIEDFS